MIGDGPPPSHVIGAFQVHGVPVRLSGGGGRAWRVGDAVLKPIDVPAAQLDWQANLFASLHCRTSVRLPLPITATGGELAVDGWCANTFLEGAHLPRRWREIIDAGEAFHRDIAEVPRPAFLDDRNDPWAIGDRVAWGELSIDDVPETKHVERLIERLQPVERPFQLIHGDLTGNVLFHDRLPPAVIDFAPYFRPALFATAVVAADALVWEGADESLVLALVEREPDFVQFLLRALIYRAVTDRLFRLDEPLRADADDAYLPAVDLAAEMTR
jgi:uncharacterized protein (TIGR02569 family)